MAKVMELQNQSGGHWAWMIFCPACRHGHAFDSRWTFNGDMEKPTFRASFLQYETPPKGPFKGHFRCHSFVTDGRIEFLSDSTHAMAGQTVDLPEMPPDGSW